MKTSEKARKAAEVAKEQLFGLSHAGREALKAAAAFDEMTVQFGALGISAEKVRAAIKAAESSPMSFKQMLAEGVAAGLITIDGRPTRATVTDLSFDLASAEPGVLYRKGDAIDKEIRQKRIREAKERRAAKRRKEAAFDPVSMARFGLLSDEE